MEERKRVCEAWNNEENDDDLEVQESSPSQNLLLLGSRPQQQLKYSNNAGVWREEFWLQPIVGPSPLGLQLTINTSLMNMIQMEIDGAAATEKGTKTIIANNKCGAADKRSITTNPTLKPSRFFGSILRIGSWEWKSRYDGDLVVKFYYSNCKVVWEILSEGLIHKIETNWADICALKVTCPEGGSGSMEITLSEKPRFYRETNQQPRKNTKWLRTEDFTVGQANIHRTHALQCAPGILNKHIEKLLSIDPRLYSLSQESDSNQKNLCFGQCHSESKLPDASRVQDLDSLSDDHQFGQQIFEETVPMSVGVNAEVKYHDGPQNGMAIFNPSPVPGRSSVMTGTPSGGPQWRKGMDNSSFETLPHQTQLNFSNGWTMNDTMDSMMTSQGKQPQCNSFTSIVGASSSSLISPEDVRKFIPETRLSNSASSSRVWTVYSDDSSLNQMTREIDLKGYAFSNNDNQIAFNPTIQSSPSRNVNTTLAAMALDKLSQDLLSDNGIEPKDVTEESIIMLKVDYLSNLLQQAPAAPTTQRSERRNAVPYVEAEVATHQQILHVAPAFRGVASCSGQTGEGEDRLPPWEDSMLLLKEAGVDIDMDTAFLI